MELHTTTAASKPLLHLGTRSLFHSFDCTVELGRVFAYLPVESFVVAVSLERSGRLSGP